MPAPVCPLCHGPMVLRTARTGPAPGRQFHGCSRFPACRGTRAMGSAAAPTFEPRGDAASEAEERGWREEPGSGWQEDPDRDDPCFDY